MNTLIKFRKSVMLFVKALLVIAVTLGFVEFWSTNYVETLFSLRGNFVVIFSFVLVFVTFGSLYGAFKIGVYRVHEIIYSFSLAVIFANAVMYLELCLIARTLVAVRPMLLGIIFQILIAAAGSWCANTIYFKLYRARRMIAVFGDDTDGFSLINKMSRLSERFQIESGINANRSSIEEIFRHIDKYEAVVICGVTGEIQRQILAYCYANCKRTYLLPDITDIVINNSYSIQISDTPVLMSRNRGLTIEQEIIKRIGDIIISAIMLIVSSPFMLIAAVAIKLDDGGPVFFRQNRITKDGKIFNIIKFRSMIVDADRDGVRKATDGDDRITRVGRIIRACRIDELPQLFNVLRGDMSMVGPRPERIENVYEYSCKYPQFELRHRVKAGLTGYAQIYGKYNTAPADKLNMDLTYIETYSLLQDIKLIILTFKILFMRESTEGFSEEASRSRVSDESGKENENEI